MDIHLKEEAHLIYGNLLYTFDDCDEYKDFDVILPRMFQRWCLILWDLFYGSAKE